MPGVRIRTAERGISVLQLLVTCAVMGIVAAAALPATQRTLTEMRISGDARALHNSISLARMRASSRYTRERIYVDLTTGAYQLQYWDKAASDWVNEPGTVSLSKGVTFDTGGATQPPPNTQSSIGQSVSCTTKTGATIQGTACITFNSRGIPIDASGNVYGNSALYLTNGGTAYVITLSATPLVRLWSARAGTSNWMQR
jgi:Tfp pilus assembly protein FimT